MFKECKFKDRLGFDPDIGMYRFQYEIIDTDFSDTSIGVARYDIHTFGECDAIINVYKRRNLNVAANIVRYCKRSNAIIHYQYVIAAEMIITPQLAALQGRLR